MSLDLSKVKPEAHKYIIERWETALATQKLSVDQQLDLQNHIDQHMVKMGMIPKYRFKMNRWSMIKVLCLMLSQSILNKLANIFSEASRAKKWQLIVSSINQQQTTKKR